MTQKTAGLWARADDVVRWRRELHKLKDMATALLADLGDMTCYRLVPEQVPDDLEDQVGNFEQSDEEIKAEIAEAVAYARAEQRKKKGQSGSPAAITVPIEYTDLSKQSPKPKKSRVSYPALLKKITQEHSKAVAEYAVFHMCGAERNATRLKVAMENFLGTFPSVAEAAASFAESEGQPNLSSEDAVALISKARHKLTDPDGRVAVWANRKRGVLPNEKLPSEDDPAHKWAERVSEVNAAKEAEAEPQEPVKPKRQRAKRTPVVTEPVDPLPDANVVAEAKTKKAEKKATTKPKTPPAVVQDPIEELPPLPPPSDDEAEQDWDEFLAEEASAQVTEQE